VSVQLRALRVNAVVLDIEGTTTPIAFVHDVLFPYARAHLHEYLRRRFDSPECEAVARMLHDEWTADVAAGNSPPQWESDEGGEILESLDAYARWLMDRDRKSPGLKALQGLVWERGYRDGELHGEVYPDVSPALDRWRTGGLAVAIYSSGSVLAQRLLFGTTAYGDLTDRLSAFFDTATGAKTEPTSYSLIAASLEYATVQMLFVSDSAAELDAALAVGCQVAMCVRPGHVLGPAPDRAWVVHTFDEIV
jgi:enolase-phosphatase E1